MDGPAHRYYRALEGCWAGGFRLAVTDWHALGGLTMATKATATLAHLVGATSMSTTLHASGRDYLHTTRVRKWAIVAFETSEVITVGEDGRTFRLRGEQRPWLGRAERYEAHGEIDGSATRATYHIPWLGADMLQRTAIVPEGLELTQETAWSRAFVLLRRTRAR